MRYAPPPPPSCGTIRGIFRCSLFIGLVGFVAAAVGAHALWRKTDKLVRQAKGLDASMSEAIIIADHTTPYRLFIEVLFTLGQSEFGKYHLMVLSGKKK